MPWTRRQVKYLLSSGSPLSGEQKSKMVGELHANPGLGHAKKGSSVLKRERVSPSDARRRFKSESHAYNFRQHRGGRKPKRG